MSEEIKKETPKADAKPEQIKKVEEKPAANISAEKAEAKPEPKTAKVEKVVAKNCVKCNKPIKKKMGYYRNGKYYCNKRCFKLSKVSAASPSS